MVEAVDLKRLQELVRSGAELIDVRETEEIELEGIVTTRHLPLSEITKFCAGISAKKPSVFCCKSGFRSMKAAEIAAEWTQQPVYFFKDGLSSLKSSAGLVDQQE